MPCALLVCSVSPCDSASSACICSAIVKYTQHGDMICSHPPAVHEKRLDQASHFCQIMLHCWQDVELCQMRMCRLTTPCNAYLIRRCLSLLVIHYHAGTRPHAACADLCRHLHAMHTGHLISLAPAEVSGDIAWVWLFSISMPLLSLMRPVIVIYDVPTSL